MLEEGKAELAKAKNKVSQTKVDLSNSWRELDEVRNELKKSWASLDERLENIKVAAKIEGLEKSIALIRLFYPDLDMDILEKILSVSKGKITDEEAFGPGQDNVEEAPAPTPASVSSPPPPIDIAGPSDSSEYAPGSSLM